jgi:large subunit ribosomal protein L14
MIQDRSIIKIADNSGAKIGRVFKVLGHAAKRYAYLGDTVILSVQKAEPRKQTKKKDVHKAVVVRARQAFRRKDGSYVRFDENAVVILDGQTKKPKGNRVFGPIPRDLREKGYTEIMALSKEII